MAARVQWDLKSKLLLGLLVVISVFIPVQFWRGVWFGGKLTDDEISAALRETGSPRHLQHALTQIEERIRAGDTSAEAWQDDVARLAGHPLKEVRVQAAWVMGQDNRSERFHEALLKLLGDPEPIVERNAALGLTRFADQRAIPVLRTMLQASVVPAPASGSIRLSVEAGQMVALGEEVALIGSEAPTTVLAPLGGRVTSVTSAAAVSRGEAILELAPDPQHVWEALRALLLIGGEAEIPLVQQILEDPRYSEIVHEQARLTLESLRSRSEPR